MPDKDHAKHVQAREHQLLDHDRQRNLADIVKIVRIFIKIENAANDGHDASRGSIISARKKDAFFFV